MSIAETLQKIFDQHPAPWHTGKGHESNHIEDANNNYIFDVSSAHLNYDEDKALASHICACINAMKGIHDPETWMKTTQEILAGNLKTQANWSKVIAEQRSHIEMLHSELEKSKGGKS